VYCNRKERHERKFQTTHDFYLLPFAGSVVVNTVHGVGWIKPALFGRVSPL
jgi:hypothetical protein